VAQGKVLRRIWRVTWKLALLAIVAGGVVYYLRFRPVPVKAFIVKSDTVRSEVMGTGTLDARTKITISSKITGRIAALGADQNDQVSKDKMLAMLDDSDLRQQVEMAAASLDATKAALVRAETDIARLAKQTDRETREFLVDVLVKELPKNWSVGQRAEVYIQTGAKADVPSIPQRLLLWREGKPGVFVDDGGKAHYQEVGLGIKGRETVEIARGLKIGQVVITAADGDNSNLTEGRARA